MGQFETNNCGLAQVDLELHPLTEAWRESIISTRHYIPKPAELTAMNNIVLSGIVVPYEMFVTDSSGEYQNDFLIGKRIVSSNAEGFPQQVGIEIELDSTTGTITSVVTAGRHWLTIGYDLNIDLMP